MRVARGPASQAATRVRPSPEDTDSICAALLAADMERVNTILAELREKGRSDSEIALGYLSEAARRLGEMWERDEVSFVQVGQAVGRIQRLSRNFRPRTLARSGNTRRRALFATLPSETHTLGVILAADALRMRGWEIDLGLGESHDTLVELLTETDYPVLGVSVGAPHSCTELAEMLDDIRAASPTTRILLGGPLVSASPWRVRSLAVDAWASDADTAFAEMNRLVASTGA